MRPHALLRRGRGVAALALLAIVLITVGWWGLALYPLGNDAPDWVSRTRAACFGAVDDALPSAGGWLLLIGEPIGMVAVLVIVWGEALGADLRAVAATIAGRVLLGSSAVALAVGVWGAAARVATALDRSRPETFTAASFASAPVLLDAPAPAIDLVDQRGERFSLVRQDGETTIVTFAFAHCADVCPTLVHQLRQARDAITGPPVRIVVVTLDPWRDTPSRLPTIAAQWALAPQDRLLSGTIEEVNRVLDAWSVGRSRDPSTGVVDHAAVAYLVDSRGHLTARLDGGMDRMRDLLAGDDR